MYIQFKVKPVGIRQLCDECLGEMKYEDGNMFLSNPPKFKHTCEKCGHVELFDAKYPTVRWIEE